MKQKKTAWFNESGRPADNPFSWEMDPIVKEYKRQLLNWVVYVVWGFTVIFVLFAIYVSTRAL